MIYLFLSGSTVTEKELLSNLLLLHQLRLNFFARIWLTHIFQAGDVSLERTMVLVCVIYRLLVLFNPASFSGVTIDYVSQLFRWLYDKNASSMIRSARLKSGLVWSKLSKIVKMLVRSCFLTNLIKCLKGHRSLGSLFNVKCDSVTRSTDSRQDS